MGHYVTAVIRSSKIDRDGQMQIVLEIPFTQIGEARQIASLVQQNLHVTVMGEREFRIAKKAAELEEDASHGQTS